MLMATLSLSTFRKLKRFNRVVAFPLEAQLREAELLKKCSPTVSLEYPEKARLLWASVIEKDWPT